jgi:hypothetical protein
MNLCVLRIPVTRDIVFFELYRVNIQFLMKIRGTLETLWWHTGCGAVGYTFVRVDPWTQLCKTAVVLPETYYVKCAYLRGDTRSELSK